jgi:LysM repeat protein
MYVVQKGDTLYSIARKFNLVVDQLKQKNNLSANTLSIGQKLIVD